MFCQNAFSSYYHSSSQRIVFHSLVPVQQNPIKVQMLAFQLQLWPNAEARQVDYHNLWIVLDMAYDAVLYLAQFCWIGPHGQLLAEQKNIHTQSVIQ